METMLSLSSASSTNGYSRLTTKVLMHSLTALTTCHAASSCLELLQAYVHFSSSWPLPSSEGRESKWFMYSVTSKQGMPYLAKIA